MTTRYNRWFAQCSKIAAALKTQHNLVGPDAIENLADERMLAASCGAHLIEEQPALEAEIRETARTLGVDLEADARLNAAQVAYDRQMGRPL